MVLLAPLADTPLYLHDINRLLNLVGICICRNGQIDKPLRTFIKNAIPEILFNHTYHMPCVSSGLWKMYLRNYLNLQLLWKVRISVV
jgi:hypothetical protein